jgi:polyisoprenyl-teichoic acid--peptidoglycan teichoic acid transferase
MYTTNFYVDPFADTQPSKGLTRKNVPAEHTPGRPTSKRKSPLGCGIRGGLLILGVFLIGIAVYLFFPGRTNIIILGVDDRAEGGVLGRTDTMILTTFTPLDGYVGMLSIPRDLWVQIPGVGENRINTAHFFAEANIPGSGMDAAKEVIRANFGVDVEYAVRVRFDNFLGVVQQMGGLEVSLDTAMSGYDAGVHKLTPEEALAFVRDRSGSDDFFRMQRSQIFLRSLFAAFLRPENILEYPTLIPAVLRTIETDVPIILWPRLAINLLRSGISGIDARTISREMVFPFTTNQGAQVLAPNWEMINPVLLEMFDQ